MSLTFQSGNRVKLQSGGVAMTVRCTLGDGRYPEIEAPYRLAGAKDGDVLCEWQDKNHKQQARAYHPAMLKPHVLAIAGVSVRRRR